MEDNEERTVIGWKFTKKKKIPEVKLLPLREWQKWKAEVVPVEVPSTTSPETASDHPHWPRPCTHTGFKIIGYAMLNSPSFKKCAFLLLLPYLSYQTLSLHLGSSLEHLGSSRHSRLEDLDL